jgi:hypothetical protein
MPLPSVEKYGARQCSAKNRKTGLRCKNPSAWSCKTCRYHGAKKNKKVKSGKEHYRFIDGSESIESRKTRSEASLRFHLLEEIGLYINLFVSGFNKTPGRKPNGWQPYDLGQQEGLTQAILKTLPSNREKTTE